MRRYIALAVVMLSFSGCSQATIETTEITSENVVETTAAAPEEVKPTTADVRTYCVSLDAARNTIIADYKDKIPEKLVSTFDANSNVLDEYMDKAAADLSDADAEKIFNELKKLEVFFCETIAEEVGAGDKIQEIALNATKNADYYFEKAAEELETEETTAEETSIEETTEK